MLDTRGARILTRLLTCLGQHDERNRNAASAEIARPICGSLAWLSEARRFGCSNLKNRDRPRELAETTAPAFAGRSWSLRCNTE